MELTKNSIGIGLITITVSILTGMAILNMQFKTIFALIIVIPAFIYWKNCSPEQKIVLTILSVTFPILLQFLGKDALTTGTLVILFTFLWYCSRYNAHRYLLNNFFIKVLMILLMILLVGWFIEVPVNYYGHVMRQFIAFLTSIMLFYIIVFNYGISSIFIDKSKYIDLIITTFLLIFTVHIALSIAFYYLPSTQSYFQIFFHRTQSQLTGQIDQYGHIVRASSIFVAGEQYGELLAVLYPFLLYKYFKSNKKISYILLLLLYFFALGLSATRSAAILVLLSTIIVFSASRVKKYSIKKKFLFILLFTLSLIAVLFSADIFHVFTERFQTSLNQVSSNKDIIYVLNRQTVWIKAWHTTINTISLFGHGPGAASQIGYNVPHFHCLYLTLLFQFGIVGTILYLYLFYYLLKKFIGNMYKSNSNSDFYLLNFICLLSLLIFLINEVKYEFNRNAPYQQFIWGIIGIYYLVATTVHLKGNINIEKDNDNKSKSVRLSN